MKKLLLVALCLTAPAFGVTYTACTNGNWNDSTKWTPNGIPVAGDTITIPNGCTMTVPNGYTAAFGLNTVTTCTADLTVQSGGNLTIAVGGTLAAQGGINLDHNSTYQNFGVHQYTPPNTSTACNILNATNTSTGAATVKICGNSDCTTGGTYAQLTCAGGNCQAGSYAKVNLNPGGGAGINLTWDCAKLDHLGDATHAGWVQNQIPSTGVYITHALVWHSGFMQFNWSDAASDFKVSYLSLMDCQDTTGSGNQHECWEHLNTTAPTTATRTYDRIYAGTDKAVAIQKIRVDAKLTANFGKSVAGGDGVDVPSAYLYQSQLATYGTASTGRTTRSELAAADINSATGMFYHQSNAGDTFQDSILYNHIDNAHFVNGGTTNDGGAANVYQRLIFSDDWYVIASQTAVFDNAGTFVLRESMCIETPGCFPVGVISATASASALYNLDLFGGSVDIGETAGSPTGLVAARGNLFISPQSRTNSGNSFEGGLHGAQFLVRNSTLGSSTANSWDYNYFCGMPGTNECNNGNVPAATKPPLVIHPTLSLNGPMRIPTTIVNSQEGTTITATLSGTTLTCANCHFCASGSCGVVDNSHTLDGDYILDCGTANGACVNATGKYGIVSGTPADDTHLTLAAAIPGFVNGNGISVRMSYSTAAKYGDANMGGNDVHMAKMPLFANMGTLTPADATIGKWYNQQAGTSFTYMANQPAAGGTNIIGSWNDLTSTAGTTTSSVTCSACFFSTWGIKAGDIVEDFVGSGTTGLPRGYCSVNGVTSNTVLTCSNTVTGMASGDHFTFVTNERNFGLSIVQGGGFDVNGNAVTPPSWVNDSTVANLYSYLKWAATPYNLELGAYRTGGDGHVVGPIDVPPVHAIISPITF